MNCNQEWETRQQKDAESRRAYEYERLTVAILDEIYEAMERSGLTKADVARILGTSRANVTQIFAGSRNLTVKTLSDLAWACDARLCVKWQPMRSGNFVSSPIKLVRRALKFKTTQDREPPQLKYGNGQ